MDVHYLNETNILLFLLQVFILLLATRCLGEVFRKWNQPALTAEILIGVILGPTIWVETLGYAEAIFPYRYPALFSMIASFTITIAVSLLDRSDAARREQAAFEQQYVRSITGMGASGAARH